MQNTIKYRNKKYNGIWFFGFSGVGKTFASKYVKTLYSNSMLIDGDIVRKYISTDLGRDINSREIQLQRLLGIAKLSIRSKIIPIVSCVYMDLKNIKLINKSGILLLKIERSKKTVFSRNIYKTKKNVVGKDLKYPILKTQKIYNDGTEKFVQKIKKFF